MEDGVAGVLLVLVPRLAELVNKQDLERVQTLRLMDPVPAIVKDRQCNTYLAVMVPV